MFRTTDSSTAAWNSYIAITWEIDGYLNIAILLQTDSRTVSTAKRGLAPDFITRFPGGWRNPGETTYSSMTWQRFYCSGTLCIGPLQLLGSRDERSGRGSCRTNMTAINCFFDTRPTTLRHRVMPTFSLSKTEFENSRSR